METLAAALRILEAGLSAMRSVLAEPPGGERDGAEGAVEGGSARAGVVALSVVQRLTRRELRVCELLVQGLSNRAIGTQLGISERTVKNHVQSVFVKLGAHNRAEVVRRALTGQVGPGRVPERRNASAPWQEG